MGLSRAVHASTSPCEGSTLWVVLTQMAPNLCPRHCSGLEKCLTCRQPLSGKPVANEQTQEMLYCLVLQNEIGVSNICPQRICCSPLPDTHGGHCELRADPNKYKQELT